MLNVTTRLAIRIESTPDWFDWSDQSSQGCRSELKAVDILPDMKDVDVLHHHAVAFIQRFLVQEFKDLHHLKAYVPTYDLQRDRVKTEIVPMKILFKDEKYVTENVLILGDLVKDTKLDGSRQVST